ncbi:hypothetical protein [Leminorella grimontii]|uniref:hypothetical protein n=1 Tax=Leminorella grimontii TaxID=82981 RepID=UPI002083DB11|nr:hypothetical protein [Leminorella grimontii]GKX60730.1 hypothetical protein SOASR031_30450 [Leminorella grimontii]
MDMQLFSALNDDTTRYRYLLLDGLGSVNQMDMVYVNNIKQMLGDEAVITVPRPDLSHEPESCPQLVLLAVPGQEVNERLVRFSLVQAKDEREEWKRYISGWMTSEMPPKTLAEHIITLARSMGALYAQPYCAFYEPFRMQLLHDGNVMSDAWLPTVLTAFKTYFYLSINGHLKKISRLDRPADRMDVFITEETKFYLREFRALFYLYQGWQEASSRAPSDRDVISLAQWYQRSAILGLENTKDRYIYAMMSEKRGDIMRNRVMAAAVNEAKADKGSLPQRLKAITERV